MRMPRIFDPGCPMVTRQYATIDFAFSRHKSLGAIQRNLSRLNNRAYAYPCQRFTLHVTVHPRMTRGHCEWLTLQCR